MRKFTIGNRLDYEKEWFGKLEIISHGELNKLIANNMNLNQSSVFKYKTIERFVIILMNMYNRVELANKIIEAHWSKMDKSSLIDQMFIYGDWDTFKKYWKKNRSSLGYSIITLPFRTDEIERTKWILSDKKFDNVCQDDYIENLAEANFNQYKFFNKEGYELLVHHPEVKRLVFDLELESLYPQEVKDVFIF